MDGRKYMDQDTRPGQDTRPRWVKILGPGHKTRFTQIRVAGYLGVIES